MLRRLALVAGVLAANAVLAAYWWVVTSPEAYLWRAASPDTMESVRSAARAVFWARWPVWALLLNAAVAATLLLRAGRPARAAAVFGVTVLGSFAISRWEAPRLADEYFTLFQRQERPEPLLVEPIEDAGPAIGPYLLSYIRRPDAELVRYAIGGLGRIGYTPAVPELTRMMNDPHRPYYIRADAWEALRDIGTREAKAAVRGFEAAPGTRADTALSNYLRRVRGRDAAGY